MEVRDHNRRNTPGKDKRNKSKTEYPISIILREKQIKHKLSLIKKTSVNVFHRYLLLGLEVPYNSLGDFLKITNG